MCFNKGEDVVWGGLLFIEDKYGFIAKSIGFERQGANHVRSHTIMGKTKTVGVCNSNQICCCGLTFHMILLSVRSLALLLSAVHAPT